MANDEGPLATQPPKWVRLCFFIARPMGRGQKRARVSKKNCSASKSADFSTLDEATVAKFVWG
jgi:hypothetical protein